MYMSGQNIYKYQNNQGIKPVGDEIFKSPIGKSKTVNLGGTSRNKSTPQGFKDARKAPGVRNTQKEYDYTNRKGNKKAPIYTVSKPETRNYPAYKGSGAYGKNKGILVNKGQSRGNIKNPPTRHNIYND